MSLRLPFRSAALALLAAAWCIPAAHAQERQLPDAVGITVVEGSHVPEQCHWPRPPEDPARSGCIVFPSRLGMDVQSGLMSQLNLAGWEFIDGAANGFWLNRPIANTDCVDRLYVIGWYNAPMAEAQAMQRSGRRPETQAFLFMMKAEPLCGDQRRDP